MAVALAAISPELKVEGITTVYGDVDLRARMVNSSVHGYHRLSLDELCRRTEALARRELSLS